MRRGETRRADTALGLLRRQIACLFAPGGPAHQEGRTAVLAQSDEGLLAVIGPSVEPAAARRIHELARAGGTQPDLMTPPSVLAAVGELIEGATGQRLLVEASGPTYLVADEEGVEVEFPLLCSGDSRAFDLRGANPGNWEPEEWSALLDGELGPWAMAFDHRDVVSICHTPVMGPDSADAGTWTRLDRRGRGLAAATVAAWAPLIRASGRTAFYSTSTTNRSSQRVAERLRLRLLGTLWWFGGPPA